ncbi:hypothetical protein GKR41_00611 [Candidatus Vallotia lariciata]|nr:hypothetical protein GKR41_00611 [Candidatus Vallotia lariciata]
MSLILDELVDPNNMWRVLYMHLDKVENINNRSKCPPLAYANVP